MNDDFDFKLVGADKESFVGYVSSIDRTAANPRVLVYPSKNVYKTFRGTIANRWGMKRRGTADGSINGVITAYVWNTSLGNILPLRVTEDGKLQVESNLADGSTLVWYTILSGLQSLTRFIFDTWWDDTNLKDVLLMTNGDPNLKSWSGGFAKMSSADAAAGYIAQIRAPNTGTSSGGAGYVAGDILTISGGTAQLTVDSVKNGGASSVSILTPGASYLANDVLVLNDSGSDSNAAIKVTSVDGSGHITGISLLRAGSGYIAGASYNVLGGTGTGAQITVNTTGTAIIAWHVSKNGSGYSTGNSVVTTGGTGTGATVDILGVATGGIRISGTQSWAQEGLDPSGSVIINGNTYEYTSGTDGDTLVGITPSAAGEPANSIVFQSPIIHTDVPDANFTADFLEVIGNQAYILSYSSRKVYISADTDYTDFVVPAIRAPGDPEILILDAQPCGIAVQNKTPVIFDQFGGIYSVTFTDITVGTDLVEQTNIDKQKTADLETPLGQEFIDSVGDTVVFIDRTNQLRSLGTLRNLNVPVFPLLSLPVYTDFKNEDFTGGAVCAIGTTIHITAPKGGRDYLYETRENVDSNGNLITERLWHSPHIRAISRIVVIDGIKYGHSAVQPQIYRLEDTSQFHDDAPSNQPLPYQCVMAIAYQNNGRRQGLLKFDKVLYEGYMTRGTTLNGRALMDYQGSTSIEDKIINNPRSKQSIDQATFFIGSFAPPIGDGNLGDDPLGDGLVTSNDPHEQIPKFRKITDITVKNVFEYGIEVYSQMVDDQWEIVCLGTNEQVVEEQAAVFLRG